MPIDNRAEELLAQAQGALADSIQGRHCGCEELCFRCEYCDHRELLDRIEAYFTNKRKDNGPS